MAVSQIPRKNKQCEEKISAVKALEFPLLAHHISKLTRGFARKYKSKTRAVILSAFFVGSL